MPENLGDRTFMPQESYELPMSVLDSEAGMERLGMLRAGYEKALEATTDVTETELYASAVKILQALEQNGTANPAEIATYFEERQEEFPKFDVVRFYDTFHSITHQVSQLVRVAA